MYPNLGPVHSVYFGRISLPATTSYGGFVENRECSISTKSSQALLVHQWHSQTQPLFYTTLQHLDKISPAYEPDLVAPFPTVLHSSFQVTKTLLTRVNSPDCSFWCTFSYSTITATAHLSSSNQHLKNSSSSPLVLTDLYNCVACTS